MISGVLLLLLSGRFRSVRSRRFSLRPKCDYRSCAETRGAGRREHHNAVSLRTAHMPSTSLARSMHRGERRAE